MTKGWFDFLLLLAKLEYWTTLKDNNGNSFTAIVTSDVGGILSNTFILLRLFYLQWHAMFVGLSKYFRNFILFYLKHHSGGDAEDI